MPQAFGSAASGQSVEAPAWCVFSWAANDGTGVTISVSFSPVFAQSTQLQVSPLQKINVAAIQSVHIFELTTQEPLALPITFTNLPWDDYDPQALAGEGFATLLSFIRTTVNYHDKTFQLTTPDGIVETVRYMDGIRDFTEAHGQTQKHMRWDGSIILWRVIPIPERANPFLAFEGSMMLPSGGMGDMEACENPPTTTNVFWTMDVSLNPDMLDLVAGGYVAPGPGHTLNVTSIILDASADDQETVSGFPVIPTVSGDGKTVTFSVLSTVIGTISVDNTGVLTFTVADAGEDVTFIATYTILDEEGCISNSSTISLTSTTS